ncbi:hypothetical protein AKJ55_00020 [candidate division MSBL1 archaeon SCGC-AAA382M17]|uniref:DUF72 domain-containing protein n=1 Tax=candidate division MSBL1 archaeon SCGC-AAA382M17 TaxID=1698284 RepID=A0ABR5TK52_9EURY|nr:hypothetical protein AKJ55_00020 [candidate division MSBL1 archaeon SCGC-AAA382M17]
MKVGTCGYSFYNPPEGWKEECESKLQAYSHAFEVGEINRTFYKLPMTKTTERWRREAADDFEFTLKAWQALTHPTSSPTWRGKKDKLTEKQNENFGYLQPNEQIVDAWNETKKRAKALEANVCLIQTPASFNFSEKNKKNMHELLGKIDRNDLEIAWEPRGNWKKNPNEIKKICNDLDLIHVVDIMRNDPVSDHPISYLRLHGLNEDEYDYDYDYSEEELEELATKLKDLSKEHERVYCMFNNYEMYDNAQKLVEIL